jgi:hypothetical protein
MAKARDLEFESPTVDRYFEHIYSGRGQLVLPTTTTDETAITKLRLPTVELLVRSPNKGSHFEIKKIVPFQIDQDGEIIPFGSRHAADAIAARINEIAQPKKRK